MSTVTEKPKKNYSPRFSKTAPIPSLEEIKPNAWYSRKQAMKIMSWGPGSWRSAKKKGLCVVDHGGRDYVKGAELDRFLQSLATPQQDNS